MRQILTPRPALTAIAAVLALGSTSAMAQLADPAAAPAPAPVETAPAAPIALPSVTPATAAPAPAPIIAPALPDVPTPAASPEAAQPETAQPETAARETAPAEEAAPARRAEPATRTTPTREARAAPAPAPAPRAEAETAAPAPAETLTEQPVLSSTDIAGIQQTAVPEAAPEPAPVAQANDDNQLYWALGAGGALLAFGAAAFALSRRSGRRDSDTVREAAPMTPAAPAAPEPMPVTPASWAPPRTPVAATSGRFGDLEAMIAERPSAENPFITRRKRLRRAEFLMNGGHAPEQAATPAEAKAQAKASAPREQPVYHFGGKQSFRPQGWKPATT